MGFILQSFGILLSSGGRGVAVKCVNNALINMVNNGLAYKSNVCVWDKGGISLKSRRIYGVQFQWRICLLETVTRERFYFWINVLKQTLWHIKLRPGIAVNQNQSIIHRDWCLPAFIEDKNLRVFADPIIESIFPPKKARCVTMRDGE